MKEPFRGLINELIEKIKHYDLDFEVFETFRTPQRQMFLIRSGKSKTMKSKHLDGLACDFVHLKNGNFDWNDIRAYREFGDCVKEIKGLAWGGDFHNFFDGGHVELENRG